MPDNQYFERKRKNQEIADKMLSILRRKLEKLEAVEGLDVTIKLGKPLRNDGPHFLVNFERSKLLAHFQFWTAPVLIIELAAIRLREVREEPEYIFSYSEKLDKIDDAKPHMDKIIDLFLDEG